MTQQITSPSQLFAVAQGYFNENKWDEAAHYARAAVSADPDFVGARLILGEALVNLGEVGGGLAELEAAYAQDEKKGRDALVRGLVAQARQLSGDRREDEALAICDRALALAPSHGAAYALQLSLWMRKGDSALLKDDLELASDAYRRAGDVKKAEQVHTLFRWQKQADLEARARSLEIEERWQEAIAMYERLLEIALERDIKESWKTALTHCREEAGLANIFDAALKAFHAADWAKCQALLLDLLNRRLDYHRGPHFATELLDHAVKADSADFIQPLPVFSPLKLAPTVISTGNARRIVRLARWGMGRVGEVAFTRDDQYLVVSSAIGIYFFRKGKSEIVRFLDTDTVVECMALSPDSARIATGFDDGSILIWRVADGALIRKLRGHARKVNVLAFSPDSEVVASGAEDGSVRLWNVVDGKILMMMQGRLQGITGIDFSPDGRHVAIAAGDDKIRVQKIDDGSLVRVFEGGAAPYRRLVFSPNGRYLAAGLDDGQIEIREPGKSEVTHLLTSEAGRMDAVRFSHDSGRLAAGSVDGTVNLWRLTDGALEHTIRAHAAPVHSLGFSPGSPMLATSSRDNTVRLWDTANAALAQTLDGFTGGIRYMAVPAGGGYVLTAMLDGTARLWSLTDGRPLAVLGDNLLPELLACSDDGAQIAAVSADARLLVWHTSPSQLMHTLPLAAPPSALALAPDGQSLACGTQAGDLLVLDTATGEQRYTANVHAGRIQHVRYSPGGTMIATLGDDRSIKLWRATRGNLIQTHDALDAEIVSAAFTPDGAYLTCGTADGSILQWKTTTSLIFSRQFQGHASAITCLAHSPDSSMLATGLTDGSIRIWQIESENLLHTLPGHGGLVTGLAFSPDGSLLLSGGTDGIIRLWGAVGK